MTKRSLAYGAVLGALFIGGRSLAQQTRFEAVNVGAVAAVPGLQAVTVRDAVVNVCYTLFMMDPVQSARLARVDFPDISQAARERDQKLAALSAEYERGLPGAVPATLGSNPLRYQWEGQKVQSDYEHLVRQSEISGLEQQLAQIQIGPRLAVAGPAPCGATTAAPSRLAR